MSFEPLQKTVNLLNERDETENKALKEAYAVIPLTNPASDREELFSRKGKRVYVMLRRKIRSFHSL